MLSRLATLVVARRRLVLVAALLFVVAAGAVGGGVAGRLTSGGFEDPGAESTRARHALEDQLGQGDPNVVLLVTARGGDVDEPGVAAAGAALTAELAGEAGVAEAVSYWSLGSPPPLKSEDGSKALVLARIAGDEDTVRERIGELAPRYDRATGEITVEVTGFAEVFHQVGTTIEHDLARAESLALPITLVLLILVFGSVVAAVLPLAVGVIAVVGTFLVLSVLASLTDVSIFALNLTTAMGLGLAIDYSLFVVSRFREELGAGRDVADAVRRTVLTSGRTVLFSAATVAGSLAALLIFPLAFLRSFAYAGISVVLVAALGAVVVLPALLAVLGHRVDALTLWRRRSKPVGTGFWHGLATAVMRRPIPIATAVVALLVFLGSPFLGIEFGLPDDRVLPVDNPARVAADAIRDGFVSNESQPLEVVATGIGDPAARSAEIDGYARRLSSLDGVARVDALTGSYLAGNPVIGPTAASQRFAGADGTWLSVVPDVEPMSLEGEALVERVRATEAPFDVDVAGTGAQLVDTKASLFGLVPLAALLIGIVTFVVLFLMFGSILVPAKAVVLNLLSLSATFGAMVWIFQDGHLSSALDFTATGVIDASTPILMFCVAFGLSMDYEVFLLSRIKEAHDEGADTVRSVAVGLEHTGRIVTAAAVLIAVVFLAFATSGVTFIKLFGLGLAMAVLLDATLIRATLVPAFMRLAGELNWWAPAPLRRIYERWGFSESVQLVDDAAPADPGRDGDDDDDDDDDGDELDLEPVGAGRS